MPDLTTLFRLQGKATDKQSAHSYGPLYDLWMTPLVNRPARVLELGVSMYGGGDLLALAEFLPQGEIHGVDLTFDLLLPEVRKHPRIVLHEGDAYGDEIVRRLADMAFDVVIEDCLHDRNHQQEAFLKYWPLVAPGGQYVIEDLLCGYANAFQDWLISTVGPAGRVEVHDLTHERTNDNIIARIVRGETESPS